MARSKTGQRQRRWRRWLSEERRRLSAEEKAQQLEMAERWKPVFPPEDGGFSKAFAPLTGLGLRFSVPSFAQAGDLLLATVTIMKDVERHKAAREHHNRVVREVARRRFRKSIRRKRR